MPLVSVIIPAHNRVDLLRETLLSVIAQTFSDWECIVVDDGSTEDLSFVPAMDLRIRLIRQPRSGISTARNVGIAAATGDLVAFLDSDDIWLPGKLALQVHAMRSDPLVGLCYIGHGAIGAEVEHTKATADTVPRLTYHSMLRRGCPNTSTLMARRTGLQEVGGFDPLMLFAEDHDLTLRLAMRFKVAYVPDKAVLIRPNLRAGSYSRSYTAGYPFLECLIAKHRVAALRRGDAATLSATREWMPLWRGVIGAQAYEAARQSLRSRNPVDFLSHFVRALLLSPCYVIRETVRYAASRVAGRVADKPSGETAPRPD